MDKIQILETIIEEEGSCNWIAKHNSDTYRICDICPINKNGGCRKFIQTLIENNDKISTKEQNKAYKALAERKLVETAFEDMMRGDYD